MKALKFFLLSLFLMTIFSGCLLCPAEEDIYVYTPRHLPGGLDKPLTGKNWDDEGYEPSRAEGFGWPWSYSTSCFGN